jgi:hypothetical protein
VTVEATSTGQYLDVFSWFVGLAEGEASFLRPSPSKPREPKLDIEMTDEPVIRKVAALLGVAYRKRDRHRENVRMTYHVRLAGKRAVSLMWRMKPHLSERRQAQVDRAVQCYIDRGIAFHPDNLPPYAFQSVCVVGLCPEPALDGHTCCAAHAPPVAPVVPATPVLAHPAYPVHSRKVA